MSRMVTGEFSSLEAVSEVIPELVQSGIPREEIYIEREVTPGAPTRKIVAAEAERRFAGLQVGALVGLVFGAFGGGAMTILNEALVAPDTPFLALPWPFHTMGWSIFFCAVLGVVIGAALGLVVDFTLTRVGAGPPKPTEECLLTVCTDEAGMEKA